ncbi:indole-3-glycerol phosphate synthase TrpC [Brevibacterium album]|uniref:indole-3-glycerol phosphate synthase TrpC n=1 Tax=Brevibacterium album TaxID=417948 RepID=UPI000404634C|nr:indole-3-glycerol phosphate synthase TrpC [Brevibacterium album]
MTVLDSIIAGVAEDLEERRREVPLAEIRARAAAAPGARPFPAEAGFGLICEVKRRSPSKGALADIPDPAALAAAYARGGAAAISVLTERRRFDGTLADLDAVRAAVDVPVLRKDFMVDEYQFHEARAHGADIVLLIVAALTDAQLSEFLELSRALGMAALVEAHTAEELARASAAGASLVGVNTRNLKDLSVDPARFGPLAAHAPAGACLVAESGVSDAESVAAYAAAGARLVLVGEALVTGGEPEAAVARFTAAGAGALTSSPSTQE